MRAPLVTAVLLATVTAPITRQQILFGRVFPNASQIAMFMANADGRSIVFTSERNESIPTRRSPTARSS